MATYTKSATGFQGSATWTCTWTSNTTNINVTNSTFTINPLLPTVTGKITWSGLKAGYVNAYVVPIINGSPIWAGSDWYTCTYYIGSSTTNYVSWANNASKTIPLRSTGGALTTSNFFNSSNKTSRTVSVTYVNSMTSFNGYAETSGNTDFLQNYSVSFNFSQTITLDVPPTFSESNIYFTNDFDGVPYAGLTTANVTLSSLTAYYGGDFSGVGKAEFTVGSQTVTKANPVNNDVLSIPLNAVGTFTPTVKITDSRGQVTTHTLNAITVQGYVAPSVNFSAERTLSTGVPDDEGESATVTATFNFTDAIATLSAPTIAVTDDDGITQTVSTAWYSTRASDGTLSGSVNWASLSSGDTVYGLASITGDFNTQKSYQIAITPQDSEGTGTTVTQTLGSAFYTVDFYAGGHGIAFGQPATQDGFFCNMDATFNEDLVAQDMTQQEVDDFVDNISGGGSPIVDKVVEQGTSDIWTYRKWASGIAECWGTITRNASLGANAHAEIYRTLPPIFIAIPIATGSGGGVGIPNSFMAYLRVVSVGDNYAVDSYIRNNGTASCAEQWVYYDVKGKWK